MKFILTIALALFSSAIAAPTPTPDSTENTVLEPRGTCQTTCPSICDMYGWGSGDCAGCYMNCKRDVDSTMSVVEAPSVEGRAEASKNKLKARGKCQTTCPYICDMYGWGSGDCSGCYMNCK